MTNHELVAALLETGKWSEVAAHRGLAADFRCEYCDQDLLASAAAYREWQLDHIVPVSAGGSELEENLAVACRTCNVNWKSRWDPRSEAGALASRADLIAACRAYVSRQRQRVEAEVNFVRRLLGKPSLLE